MPTPFAAIEASLAVVPLAAVANATLTWGASSSADGVFNTPSSTLLGDYIQSTDPSFTGRTAQIGAIALGTSVTVSATGYTVTRNEPDGSGITVLTLQRT